MADISKITLPSGNTYDIKDAVARQAIAGGVSFIVAWNGSSTPVVANIPAGVVVTYNGTQYTGTMSAEAAEAGAFYLVNSSTEAQDIYSEYVAIGNTGSKSWEKLGDAKANFNVTLNKGTGDQVLGEGTSFTAAPSSVTFAGGSTDTFVKSYPGATSKLVTTTVPNVTSVGTAPTWNFAMGTGSDSETLIISGANGSAPTLGTAKTVATGALASNGGGSSVMTGLGTASTGPAITNVGTATAAAQTITVGTEDKVKIAKYDDLSISTS